MRSKRKTSIILSIMFLLPLFPINNSFSLESRLLNIIDEMVSSLSMHRKAWTETFGGDGDDIGFYVQQTSDDGYIVVGTTSSYGKWRDIWVIKIDEDGEMLWNKIFGFNNSDEKGYCIQETNDDGYVIAGDISSNVGCNAWLIKIDSNGDILWSKTFDDEKWNTSARYIQQTDDNGYIVTGWIYGYDLSNIWVLKLDEYGDKVWEKIIEREGSRGYCIQKTSDKGYIIVGSIYSYDTMNSDIYLVKIDEEGNKLWSKTFGGKNNDEGYCVQETRDNGYIICGIYSHKKFFNPSDRDAWLIKTDDKDEIIWNKTFGGEDIDIGYFTRETKDDGYIITGFTYSYGKRGTNNIWLIKTDSNGNEIWNRTFDFESSGGYCVQETEDGGYIMVGWEWKVIDPWTRYGTYDLLLIKVYQN